MDAPPLSLEIDTRTSDEWALGMPVHHLYVCLSLEFSFYYCRVAVCCSVLQCVAVCCSVLQRVAVCCNVLQCVAACCSVS